MSAPAALPVPRHVAFIMDGNGRWARQRGLPRIEGHRRGVEVVRTVLETAWQLGIRQITLYAFSAENWKRPVEEVGALMGLLEWFLDRETARLVENRIRLRTIGHVEALPPAVQQALARATAATAGFTEHTLVLALNYGSRDEVLEAAKAYATAVAEGRERVDSATWDTFSRYLATAGLPDPDLVIRTSGETRLSNFLLLQSAYAEFVFTPVLWPDFGKAELTAAVAEYGRRERRFGQTSEQLNPAS
ncbi:MAG: di-trans,poly-cis-decaprenylcistransferase [Verrucomicrobia bacterium]|nr:di-trans,poly-cis-decaprenylcistransferase [Verrucomicrobiota bacterium]